MKGKPPKGRGPFDNFLLISPLQHELYSPSNLPFIPMLEIVLNIDIEPFLGVGGRLNSL